MKFFALGNHLTPILLAISAVLGGTLALESSNLVRPEDDRPSKNPAAVEPVPQPRYSAPAIAAFSEITERPLFDETREPPAEPEQAVAAPTTSPLRLRLEGVAISPDAKVAVMRDLSSNKMLHLATGDKHLGWELTELSDTVATFGRGDLSVEFMLIEEKKAPTRTGIQLPIRR